MGETKRKFSPPQTYDKVRACIEAADTNKWCAAELRRMVCDAVDKDQQPDPRIMKYLASAFRDIGGGKSAVEALNSAGQRGKPRDPAVERKDRKLAAQIIDIMAANVGQPDRYPTAREMVTEKTGVPDGTIKKAYEAYNQVIRDHLAFEQNEAAHNSWDPPASACDLVEHWSD